MIAKSRAIKGRGGKSGGRAAKAVGLTSGGLRLRPGNGTEVVARRPDRGAEVSRGYSRRNEFRRRPERWMNVEMWRPRIGLAAEFQDSGLRSNGKG
jgi:hypothetical protein